MGSEIVSPLPQKKINKKMTVMGNLKYSAKHEIYSMTGYTPEYNKENQDYSCFTSFVTNKETTRLYVLADGHGPNGHFASKFCCDTIMHLLEQWMSSAREEDLTDEKIKQLLILSFTEAHLRMQTNEEDIRFYKYSGTTMVVALVRKCTLYIANLGDSRGFLASQVGVKLVTSLVSKDHKPDDPEEKKRIEGTGGVVNAFTEDDGTLSGPARVWNKHQTEPGLATSRSLGDLLAHKYGVIPVPGK
jgi:serine/threonine protein phosphatase PrpC